MLKKAGIILAATTAGVLAFTPLAFAGSKDGDSNGGGSHKHWGSSHDHLSDPKHHDSDGGDTDKDNVSNDCRFGNQSGPATQSLVGGSSLLGVADALTGTVTQATGQLNTLNCTNVNVSDLVDNNSNNRTTDADKTSVQHSFNR